MQYRPQSYVDVPLEDSAGTGADCIRWMHGGVHLAYSYGVLGAVVEGMHGKPPVRKVRFGSYHIGGFVASFSADQ